MAGSVGIGHYGAEQQVDVAVAADPGLLAGNYPIVAIADGPALQGCQVGPGVGFREILESHLLGRQQRSQELVLLLLGAPNEYGSENVGVGETSDYPGPLEFLHDDGFLVTGEAAAAVLFGVGGI